MSLLRDGVQRFAGLLQQLGLLAGQSIGPNHRSRAGFGQFDDDDAPARHDAAAAVGVAHTRQRVDPDGSKCARKPVFNGWVQPRVFSDAGVLNVTNDLRLP